MYRLFIIDSTNGTEKLIKTGTYEYETPHIEIHNLNEITKTLIVKITHENPKELIAIKVEVKGCGEKGTTVTTTGTTPSQGTISTQGTTTTGSTTSQGTISTEGTTTSGSSTAETTTTVSSTSTVTQSTTESTTTPGTSTLPTTTITTTKVSGFIFFFLFI